MMKTARFMTAGVLCLAMTLSLTSLAAPEDDYASGISAFRAQQYEIALAHFSAAYDAGLRSPVLHYNLGVTYVRLERLADAYRAFSRIGDDPEWGPLAHYNMGLVAERQGRSVSAQNHFRTAYDRTDLPRLRQLAAARLRDDTARTTSRMADPGWIGTFSLGSGYEDNVLLTDDDAALGFADDSDYFIEAFATAGRFISGNARNGWRMDFGGYYRGYRDLDDFNVGVVTAGLGHHRRAGEWHVQLGTKVDLQFAGSSQFATVPGVRLQATHGTGSVRFRIRNDLNYVNGASRYDYLTGWQNRSSVESSLHQGAGFLRAGYELELNDRDDLVSGLEEFRYSPTRHRFFVGAGALLGARVDLDARAEYRLSRYSEHNIRLDANDDPVQEAKRSEDRLTLRLRLGYRPAERWDVFAEYQYTDNDANLERYRYDNQQLMFGISRFF
jgi:hypothetical protein